MSLFSLKIFIFLTLVFSVDVEAAQFIQSNNWSLQIQGVEVMRRNDKVGIKEVAKVKFAKWLEVPPVEEGGALAEAMSLPGSTVPRVTLGLTASGRLYQVVEYNDRNIMRLLSGTRVLSDFVLSSEGHLLAIDQKSQETFVFKGEVWKKSPLPGRVFSGFLSWGLGSIGVLLATGAMDIASPGFFGESSSMYIMFNAFASVSLALNSFLVHAISYDTLNTDTDGFVSLGGENKSSGARSWEQRYSILKEFLSKELVHDEWKAPPRCILAEALPEGTFSEVEID